MITLLRLGHDEHEFIHEERERESCGLLADILEKFALERTCSLRTFLNDLRALRGSHLSSTLSLGTGKERQSGHTRQLVLWPLRNGSNVCDL